MERLFGQFQSAPHPPIHHAFLIKGFLNVFISSKKLMSLHLIWSSRARSLKKVKLFLAVPFDRRWRRSPGGLKLQRRGAKRQGGPRQQDRESESLFINHKRPII